MKSKAPLSLMEQLIMLLVFALAAALCLQVFVLSGRVSRSCETKSNAVAAVQSAAEITKACKGDPQQLEQFLGGSAHRHLRTVPLLSSSETIEKEQVHPSAVLGRKRINLSK